MSAWPSRRVAASTAPVLIMGGAGFIGTNLADRLARGGRRVMIYDNLSRAGVERNIRWLKREHGDLVQVAIADIRDAERLRDAVRQCGQVFHFAAQVAVTTSFESPSEDFAVNAVGTMNLIEGIRACVEPPSLVFTSTNKVYGGLDGLRLSERKTRYVPDDDKGLGVDENRPLDFRTPYGCSKGAADQYVLDYCRSFSLPTVVLRMSCIYGPHQCGTEDQGWVAHFLIRALQRQPIMIFGDGKQVRDVLHVDDLVDALLAAQANIRSISGRAFNIGGGARNTLSLLELLDRIEALEGRPPDVSFRPWRSGDQRFYVSDHSAFTQATAWRPRTDVADGVGRLHSWLAHNIPSGNRQTRAGPARGRTGQKAVLPIADAR